MITKIITLTFEQMFMYLTQVATYKKFDLENCHFWQIRKNAILG